MALRDVLFGKTYYNPLLQ